MIGRSTPSILTMSFELELTIFIVSLILTTLFYLAWILYTPIHHFLYHRFTVRFYYRKVRKIVLDHDFYLINTFQSRVADSETFHIDHIIVGDKYVYAIRDRYYPGTLISNPLDEEWTLYTGKKKVTQIPNPISVNRYRVERLCLIAPIDRELVIPIVLVNDDCYYNPFKQSDEAGYFLSLKQLGAFIDIREKEDIPSLDPVIAQSFANDLAKIKNRHDPQD